MIACGCWVCTSDDARDKRLRSSVMIEQGDVRILIDAGPDFRRQMLREGVGRLDGIVLTHAHKDHIGGLDDVRALNYAMGRAVNIYAEPIVQQVVRKDFDYAFSENPYPGVPEMHLVDIGPEPFRVGAMEVVPIRGYHHRLPILGFRVGKIAYLTDFNRIDQVEIEKIKGVEVLVINALRREHHISHFTLDEALHVRWLVGAKRTYLTHLSHQMGRYAAVSVELPQGVFLAYDGLQIEA